MALATTSAVWRSTGGDATRTAYAGSTQLVAQFYVANTAATANVAVSSTNNAAVILPANAVVTSVLVTTGAGGNSAANIGFTPIKTFGPGQTITLGTAVPNGILSGANVAARATVTVGSTGQGTQLGNVANATTLVIVTAGQGSAGANAGAVSGLIKYYVADNGQQNV